MKSVNNRYRDPRTRYKLDDWTRKKPAGPGKSAPGAGKRKLVKG
jgi:hypothetical protein